MKSSSAAKSQKKATSAKGTSETPKGDADLEVNEEDVSEQDLQAAMDAAIQEKKKQKFDKMIERGSKIAA